MRRSFIYAGIFAVALATLMLEILLTRLISVIAWYHLAFFIIALAMLGMTAGAVIVFLARTSFADVPQRMFASALGFAVVAPPVIAWAMSGPLMPVQDLMGFVALLGLGGALALPFVIVGITLTLALTRAGLPPGRAYGVDLLGAALGAVVVIPLLDAIDAASAVLVAGSIAAVGAAAFALGRGPVGRTGAVVASVVAVLWAAAAGLNAAREPAPLRPAWVKGQREDPAAHAYVAWNTHSRVTVSPTVVIPPMLWAAGRNMPPAMLQPVAQRIVKIDGAAATAIAENAHGDHSYLEWDVATFAHRLRPHGAAAVIGVGGGRDVLAAAHSGHNSVVGVELNAKIIGLHRDVMPEFSRLTELPGVVLVTDEARSYFARDREHYDVITMSLIDTWAAAGTGAYALAENGLYTVEAWTVFLQRLTPRGIFTVSRWYKANSPGETARMLALAMATLWRQGATAPREHLILLQQGNVATLLVSPSPFTPADLDRMQAEAVRLGFNMVLTPRRLPSQPLLRALIAQPDPPALAAFAASQALDLSPPTDDRPFFFNMLRPGHWLADGDTVDHQDFAFLGNLQATQTLVHATLVSIILTIVAVFGPLWLRRRALAAAGAPSFVVAACAYFALIGLGFMFVEIALLSRVGVLLGHPTLALAVVLGGIILATGIGSLLSSGLALTRRRTAVFFPLAPGVAVIVTRALLDPVMATYAGASLTTRVLWTALLIVPPALAMGLCFPLGLRLVLRNDANLGPWLWGVNGAFGVCASGLALATSIAWGIDATLAIGAVCYLALPICTWWLTRGPVLPALSSD